MKKTLVAILFTILLQSCVSLNSCNKPIEGRYYAKNNETVVIFLDINEDGTFYHYFKNNTNEFSHNGSWKKSEDGYCIIEFSNWESYNKDGVNFEKQIDGMLLFINENSLDYTPDGSNSSSYKKNGNGSK